MRIIYDLTGLSDEEIEKYKAEVAVYFGLDPALNPFDVLWLTDPSTGLKRRQIYSRRGTTDLLRDKHSISVTEMTKHDGPGYVSFIAKGVNKEGRQEMAVGSCSTEGLQGERLAARVMTAETRAGRRLTLKFVGMGILDDSETTDTAETKTSPADLVSVAPAPMFSPLPTPNAAPGKMVNPQERAAADSIAQAQAEAAEISRKALEAIATASATPQAAFVEAFNDSVQDPGHLLPGEPAGYGISGPPKLASSTEAPAAPKQRRTRKKNTVDISTPRQVSASAETPAPAEKPLICVDCKQPLSDHGLVNSERVCGKPLSPEQVTRVAIGPLVYQAAKELAYVPPQAVVVVPVQANSAVPTQVDPVANRQMEAQVPMMQLTAVPHPGHMTMTLPTPPVPAHQPILAPSQPAPTTPFPGQPSKEQETQYREKLREYSNVILPGAGMTPSQGIGGPSAKLRLYAERMSGKPTQQMTTDDWDELFNGMVDFRSRNGDKSLVKYINDVIGAK